MPNESRKLFASSQVKPTLSTVTVLELLWG